MRYGIRLVLGNVWVPAVQTLQALVITIYVFDYGSEIGYYNLALQIGQIIGLVGMFTDSLQAPIAEAWEYKVAHGKEKYLERLFVSSYKWVNILNFFLSSSLLVIGSRLILGFSGPTWVRAAYFFVPVLISQFLGPYSWIGDKFLLGCKMPTTIMWIWIAEQGIRALGLLILVPLYGMAGVLYAYIPGLLTKNITLLIIIRKKITRPKMYYWQTWIAPGLAALINWFLLESLAKVFWKGDLVTSIGLFFIAVLGFINVYGFLTGFLGAWDQNEMKELEYAVKIGHKAINFFNFVIYNSARLAFIIKSPFIGKSKIDIWEQAQKEMDELQQMKKKLIL
jgi:O-antigen/teichoic acid export membrane protein